MLAMIIASEQINVDIANVNVANIINIICYN